MAQKKIEMRIENDPDVHNKISEWADSEERSARRHVAVVLRRLTSLRETNPADLQRLGLMDRTIAAHA